MALTIRLSDSEDDNLKAQLEARAAANRQALSNRTTAKATQEAVKRVVQKDSDESTNKVSAAVPRRKPDEQTAALTTTKGFQFYYTITNYWTNTRSASEGLFNAEGVNRMRSDYANLTAQYGSDWPTGVTEVDGLPPHYTRAGARYDVPFSLVYTQDTPRIPVVLSKFSNFSGPSYPTVLPKPFTNLQVRSVSAPTVVYQGVTPLSSVVSLTTGFSGQLSKGYTKDNNVMFCVSPDTFWDVTGWPAPNDPAPFPIPVWVDFFGRAWSTYLTIGGNREKFPDAYLALRTATLKLKRATVTRPHQRFVVFVGFIPTPRSFYSCITINPLGAGVVFPTCGHFEYRYRGVETGKIYLEPGEESVSFTEADGYTEFKPDTPIKYFLPTNLWLSLPSATRPRLNLKIHTFLPSLLRTAEEASQQGFVLAYLFNDRGIFTDTGLFSGTSFIDPVQRQPIPNDGAPFYKYPSGNEFTSTLTRAFFMEEAHNLDLNLIDLRTELTRAPGLSTPFSGTYFTWLNNQHRISKRVEQLLINPNQKFFGLLDHTIGADYVARTFAGVISRTPYRALNNALDYIRSLAGRSYDNLFVSQQKSLIDRNFTDAKGFNQSVRNKLKDLIDIRYKVLRAMVVQYLGAGTLEAIRQGRVRTPAGTGKLQ
jgi:hypothetical protein